MNDESVSALTAALSSARVRAWRTHLLALHKLLIDAERRRYEAIHGPIGGPHQALQLVSRDPWFAWLRPLGSLILAIDERLFDKAAPTPEERDSFAREIRALLQSPDGDMFGDPYRRSLQELPELVVAHGILMGLLSDRPAADR